MKAIFYGILAFLLFIAAIIGLTVYSGFAVSLLWGWLVAPTFGLAAISLVQGIGLALFIQYFLRGVATKDLEKDEDKSVAEKVVENLFKSFFTTTLFIGFGWIVAQYM